jgi:sn-glycerol 3-phosphate transport system ATP-binding protein
VFLFDEPLSNLDAKLRVQMRLEIKKLQGRLGITSVYVTHDQVEAMTLGHRLMVLCDGYVEQLGTPIELYEHPATRFVAGFIGSPAMNFLVARIANDGHTVDLPGGDSLALVNGGMPSEAGRAVTLGIRPEHLEMAGEGNDIAHLHVDVVEQLGADTLVHGHFGSDRTDLTVRLLGIQSFGTGETLPFTVAPEHLHLFDAETGKRICG